ncbi:MAG: 5'-methylthioadenosine/S-adenosylhomocysteine nucleosidase, partial [Firmicutes bacterium]|nr:5'-methylthioadenosine/S-adenosylhomocysteine nucleosidase [Bacillota bacterium]
MSSLTESNLKIAIICAGDDELAPFLEHIEKFNVSERAMLKIYEGTLAGIDVAVLYSGVCKVNAAIAAQILISEFGVKVVINAGVAGGMDVKLDIFDTVIADKCTYHDVADDILTDFH